MALHTGDYQEAKAFAENNIKTFPSDVDAILTNTAGCGSSMHEYRHLFKGSEYENQAAEFSDRVLDVSVFLSNLGITPPPDSNGSIMMPVIFLMPKEFPKNQGICCNQFLV